MVLTNELLNLLGPERALVEPASLLAYECDGFTVHKQPPLAVVLPETTTEVQAIVRLVSRHETPFVPRGAGTGLSGGAVPNGDKPAVLVDTSRMRKILHVSTVDLSATVQPGVVNLDLTKAVQQHGLHYAPDPSSQAVCTIGGNLAENSGSPHCFKYGMTADHILGARVVLPSGEIVDLGEPASPRPVHGLDLIGLFTGSEGTFGVATEITVRLSRDQESIRTLLASFRSMTDACATVSSVVAAGLLPAALEILDQGTIRAVEASVYRAGYPKDAAAVLLVELDGPTATINEDAEQVAAHCHRHGAIQVEQPPTRSSASVCGEAARAHSEPWAGYGPTSTCWMEWCPAPSSSTHWRRSPPSPPAIS